MARIGVFICWCGENIARTVDVKRVAEAAAAMPGVVHAEDYKYMCSEPGQRLITDAIRDKRLTGLVVAACSPQMHEKTFRKAAESAGLNPYLVEMANIREHCSWVHDDSEEATAKAIDIVRMMVAKVRRDEALQPIDVPVTKRALVIGGGIAGIEAALSIANGGAEVVLVEKEPSIGGRMAQLGETFPTLDCSQCIMTPKMVEVAQHPNIRLLTYAEVDEARRLRRQLHRRNPPQGALRQPRALHRLRRLHREVPRQEGPERLRQAVWATAPLSTGRFPQAVPNKPVIDAAALPQAHQGRLRPLRQGLPDQGVNYEDKDADHRARSSARRRRHAAYDVMPAAEFGEYGYGKYPDVITSLQFERLESASGPTGGKIVRPSDGAEPKSVVFIQCCRLARRGQGPAVLLQDMLHVHRQAHDALQAQGARRPAYVFYIDVRAGGKATRSSSAARSRRTAPCTSAAACRTSTAKAARWSSRASIRSPVEQVEIRADLVVLATAVTPRKDAVELSQILGISHDTYGFYSEAHPKLKPVETAKAGIFLAGMCSRPARHPRQRLERRGRRGQGACRSEGRHAPARAARLQGRPGALRRTAATASTRAPTRPSRTTRYATARATLSRSSPRVNEGVCQGCGVCVALCRSKSIDLAGFNDSADVRTDRRPYEVVTWHRKRKNFVPKHNRVRVQLVHVRRRRPCRHDAAQVPRDRARHPRAVQRAHRSASSSSRRSRRAPTAVLVSGCHPGDCHYISGNYYARRRWCGLPEAP